MLHIANFMQRHLRLITALLALVAGIALYYFNPSDYVLAPKCMMKSLTGWDCPGCGIQRAFHAASHGNWTEAIGYNLFLVYSLPYFLCIALTEWVMWGKWKKHCRRVFESREAGILYIILFVVWGIARNIWNI